MNIETVYREEIPGFIAVFESVRRLSTFHKIEFEDMVETAAMAVWHHKNNIQAAIKEARQALNAERRQRFGRPVFEEKDQVEEEAEIDVLDGKPILFDFDHEADDKNEDADYVYQDYEEGTEVLPSWVRGRVGQVFYWASRGLRVPEIAIKIGISERRVAQIIQDKNKILVAFQQAMDQGVLFSDGELPQTSLERVPTPTPRKNKPRTKTASLRQSQIDFLGGSQPTAGGAV